MIQILLILLAIGIVFYLFLGLMAGFSGIFVAGAYLIKYLAIIPWAYILKVKDFHKNPFVYYFMLVDMSFPKESALFTEYFLAKKPKNAIMYGKVLDSLKSR